MAVPKFRADIREELWYITDISAFPLLRLLRNHFKTEKDARHAIRLKLWGNDKEYDVMQGKEAIDLNIGFFNEHYKIQYKNRQGRLLKYAYPKFKGFASGWNEKTSAKQAQKSFRTLKRLRARRRLLQEKLIEELKNQKT